MTKAKNVTPIKSGPTVTIRDYQQLLGPLYNGQGYATFKGRCILQVIQNVAFSAYAAGNTNDKAPAESAAAALEREMSCTPFKEGVDASLESFDKPELAGKKPRKDLIFDLLHQEDRDPEKTEELVKAIKIDGINAYIKSFVRKNSGLSIGGSKGVGRRIAAGAHALEECDASWDEAFLTKAVEFLIEFQDEKYLRSEEDKANYSYMKAVMNGVQPDEEEAPLTYAI